MTSTDEHIKKIKEHLDELEDAINEGIEKKPVTIGFNCSACSMQLLELYLHLTNKIPIGKVIKHDWFKKPHKGQKIDPLIERKLPINFEEKENIYNLIYQIEENRDNLIYGRAVKEQIEKVYSSFLKLKEILISKIKQKGVEIG